MGRFAPLAVLLLSGCSNRPIADLLDVVKPTPVTSSQADPAPPALPTYPAAPPVMAPPAPGLGSPPAPPPNWPAG
jgi:hypothetical protein